MDNFQHRDHHYISLLLAILLQIIVNTMIIGKLTHHDGRYHDNDDDEDNDNDNDDDEYNDNDNDDDEDNDNDNDDDENNANDNDDEEVSCKLYFVKTGFGRSRDKSRHISPTALTIVSHS